MAKTIRVAAGITAAYFVLSVPAIAVDRTVKTVYCVQDRDRSWHLDRFKPLISLKARTVFAELSIADGLITEFRLRQFDDSAEVSFDYHFNPDGRLNTLVGSVKVVGAWQANANVTPEGNDSVTPYQVVYRRGEERIPRPENANDYIGRLDHPPVYSTSASVPCAAMVRGA